MSNSKVEDHDSTDNDVSYFEFEDDSSDSDVFDSKHVEDDSIEDIYVFDSEPIEDDSNEDVNVFDSKVEDDGIFFDKLNKFNTTNIMSRLMENLGRWQHINIV